MDQLDTSSKVALKVSCLRACGNDIAQADRLYGYLSDGLDLPDRTPPEPSTFDRIRSGADELLGWIDGHRDTIAQGIALVRSLGGKVEQAAASVLPEIPKP